MNESLKPHISGKMWIGVIVFVSAICIAVAVFVLGKHEHASEAKYVGPKKCASCHPQQAASWAETRMAKSFEVLRAGIKVKEKEMVKLDPNRDYTHDPLCLRCHTTGYGLVGGFESIETTPEMAGVTCESCHGHGGSYADVVMRAEKPTFQTADARKAGLVYPPTEAVCKECHNPDSPFVGMDYKFDYGARVKEGTHQHFQLKYDHGN